MKKIVAVGMAMVALRTALGIALSITSVSPAKANPALLAPAAFCAGTAGVGCVLLGTVLIGGTVYYIWQLSNGHKIRADARGRVFHSEYLEDPEKEPNASGRHGDSGIWEEVIYAGNFSSAVRQCKQKAAKYKVEYLRPIYDPLTKQFRCQFRGGN